MKFSHFGKNLISVLDELGLKQTQLASMMKVSDQYISDLTKKPKVSQRTVEKVAKTLKISIDKLTDLIDPPEIGVSEALPVYGNRPPGFTGKPIPYFDMDVTAGEVNFFDEGLQAIPTDYFYLPAFQGCKAFPLSGDSMAERYNPGDILFFEEIDYWRDGYVDFGQVFLVVTRRGLRTVKYVKRGSTPDTWLLEPHNIHHHQAFEVPISSITRMFKVRGKFQKDSM